MKLENNIFEFKKSKFDILRVEKNIKKDKRKFVNDTSKFPYSAIGLLKLEFNEEVISYRTGLLISKNIVLTAGHNLYEKREYPKGKILGSPKNIIFYPGLNKNKSKFKSYESSNFFFPQEFKENNKDNNLNEFLEDYGFIIFKENISEEYFELKEFDEKKNYSFYICGYPLNKSENDYTIFNMYIGKGEYHPNKERCKYIKSSEFLYSRDLYISYGQSGSGICYIDKNNKHCVCGIMVRGNDKMGNYYGALITDRKMKYIKNIIDNI